MDTQSPVCCFVILDQAAQGRKILNRRTACVKGSPGVEQKWSCVTRSDRINPSDVGGGFC